MIWIISILTPLFMRKCQFGPSSKYGDTKSAPIEK